ncbi:MAG: transcription elongation factor GreA [Firmicutes bacterium]|nr:transcription elongation factor GreA [Bacillota bacterium]
MADNMNGVMLLTQEGYDKIVKEHDELVSVRRAEVAERIKEAISYGDISENAEYDAAKNEQAELEERIYELEDMLKRAKIVSDDEVTGDVVNVGLRVDVKDVETGDIETFSIVGATESSPFEGKISNESAIGKGLIGHKTGDVVAIEIPDGMVTYEVLKIEKN